MRESCLYFPLYQVQSLKMVSDITISALIGAIVAIIVNLIIFIYTTYIRNKRDFLKRQISDLLLPLYFHIHLIDSENIDRVTNTFRKNTGGGEEAFMKVLIEDKEIKKIAAKNLLLASQDLSSLLLEFLELQYAYESGLDDCYDSKYILKNYENLRKTIYKDYNEKKELYQKNYWFL